MVHQYKLNGYNIVLDSCSGSIHVVDEVAYDIIALYEEHTPAEITTMILDKYGHREDVTETDIRECLEDVEALKQAGKLYSPFRRCGQGIMPACCPYLQPELRILFCQSGQIPW